MRPGKISQAVFERSVRRPLAAVQGDSVSGYRCAETAVRSTAFGAVDGFCMPGAEMILDEAVCKLGFATGTHLLTGLMLPADFEEESLKALVIRLGREAERAGAAIDSVDVTVSGAVMDPVLSVAAAGRRTAAADTAMPGYDLLVAGNCGAAGTGVLVRNFREQLGQHFPANFIAQAENMNSEVIFPGKISARMTDEKFFTKAAGEGGIFAALWELCEELGCGLDADIHRIPVRQETVEICEYLNRNPYRLYSSGTILLAARNGKPLQRRLLSEDAECSLIGRLTEGPGRYIHNREITRCLEKPLPDALLEEG